MKFLEGFFQEITWQQTIFAVAISTVVALSLDYLVRPFTDWKKHKQTLCTALVYITQYDNYKNYKGNENHLLPNDRVRLRNELERAIAASMQLELIKPNSELISRTKAACQSSLDNFNSGNIAKFRNTNQITLSKLNDMTKKLKYWGIK